MSKELLLDLFKQSDDDILDWLKSIDTEEFKRVVVMALKEQDRDTRHACSESLGSCSYSKDEFGYKVVSPEDAFGTVINCSVGVKDLKGI